MIVISAALLFSPAKVPRITSRCPSHDLFRRKLTYRILLIKSHGGLEQVCEADIASRPSELRNFARLSPFAAPFWPHREQRSPDELTYSFPPALVWLAPHPRRRGAGLFRLAQAFDQG
jgi:hypothetical protein